MDRRSRRTDDALLGALRSLLATHAWDDVSVRLICDVADVSRSAFYARFDDRQGLLESAFETLETALGDAVSGRGLDDCATLALLPVLVIHVRGHLSLFERSGTSVSGIAITARFRRAVHAAARLEILGSTRVDVSDDRIAFTVGGVFAVLDRWCDDGCREPVAVVLDRLDRYVGIALALDRQHP